MKKSLLLVVCCWGVWAGAKAQVQTTLEFLAANSTSTCNINVSWATSSETDMAYFTILRAPFYNDTAFSAIGSVPAIGNSSTLVYYSLIDSSFINDSCYYYQLKAVSNSGQSASTDFVSACRCDFSAITKIPHHLQFSLSPNPATNTVTITVDESLVGSSATITDVTGRKVAAVQLQTINTKQETTNLSGGIYLVTITGTGGRSGTKKLVIQK